MSERNFGQTGTVGSGRTGGVGIAAGVLRAVRRSLGATQQDLAEILGVSHDTVRAWESGRRSLARINMETLWEYSSSLMLYGAPPHLVALMDDAIRADLLMSRLLTGPPPERHPLGMMVPGRTLTELLAWPINGRPPRDLAAHTDGIRVQLRPGERNQLIQALQQSAEAAPRGEQGAALRRQIIYLIAAAPDGAGRAWVEDYLKRSPAPASGQWTPSWAEERSRSISAAAAGDIEAVHRFATDHLTTKEQIQANLTYWAYWTGEVPDLWRSDVQMVTTPVSTWAGNRLLDTLVRGLANQAPYQELCAHTLHSLLEYKPHLAHLKPHREEISHALDVVLADHDPGYLSANARDRLREVSYLLRSVSR